MRRGLFILIAAVACGGDTGKSSKDAQTGSSDLEGAKVTPFDGYDGDPLTVVLAPASIDAAVEEVDAIESVGPAVTFGPAGATFSAPVVIELPFSRAAFNDASLANKALGIAVQQANESTATLFDPPTPLLEIPDDIDPLGYQVGPVGIFENSGSESFDLVAKLEVDHFTTFQVVAVGEDGGSDDGVAVPDECETSPEGATCSVPYLSECNIVAVCEASVCVPDAHAPNLGLPVLPESAGTEAPEGDMPGWVNFPIARRTGSENTIGLELQTFGPVPDTLQDGVTFAEYMLLLFGDGDGATNDPHPPWEGATWRLVVRQDDEYAQWTGLLLRWDGADWAVEKDDVLFVIDDQTVSITTPLSALTGVDLCTPYKIITQARKDGVLYWKALTAGNPASDPNGPAFDYSE